jgi:REP element-mobilizing transposase RayT
MRYDPLIHHRRSTRLRGHDYASAGAYFVTLNIKNRTPVLAEIVNFETRLSAIGEIARRCWEEIPKHFKNAALDEFIIMPDHLHGIIILRKDVEVEAQRVGIQSASVGIQYIESRQIESRQERIESRRKLNQFQKVVPGSISSIIRCYKAAVTRLSRREGYGEFVWQRNFHDHIIRSGNELDRIREYIRKNVEEWTLREDYS